MAALHSRLPVPPASCRPCGRQDGGATFPPLPVPPASCWPCGRQDGGATFPPARTASFQPALWPPGWRRYIPPCPYRQHLAGPVAARMAALHSRLPIPPALLPCFFVHPPILKNLGMIHFTSQGLCENHKTDCCTMENDTKQRYIFGFSMLVFICCRRACQVLTHPASPKPTCPTLEGKRA